MKFSSSSFKFLVSSFALLLAFGGTADAQWIIDGQQTQTLNLNVSDPQALYTDGSREITGPLPFASSLTATSGWFRANLPWDGTHTFFLVNEDEELINFSSSENVGLQIGQMIVRDTGLYQLSDGASVNMEDHTLYGGWQIEQVLPYDEAIISRGFADGKYMIAGEAATQPLKFAQSLTATNGALQIYSSDNADHLGFFKTLSFQDGLQFCTEGSASMLFGSGNAGLLVGMSSIVQLEYGKRINFETGELSGSTGAKEWRVATDPIDAAGIVSRGYADTHYLRSDTPLTAPLDFDPVYSGAAFKAYAVDDGITVGYFYPRTDENGLRLSGSTSSLLIGDPAEGLNLYASSLYYSGTGARIGFEDRELDGGQWTVTSSPTVAGGIVSKGYADGRYLQRTEGITTNRVIQAGDTLVISNGLITAINP
jgi:hypothetical protein